MMRQYDKAIEAAERAVKLNPNSAQALYDLGCVSDHVLER